MNNLSIEQEEKLMDIKAMLKSRMEWQLEKNHQDNFNVAFFSSCSDICVGFSAGFTVKGYSSYTVYKYLKNYCEEVFNSCLNQ